VRHFGLRPLASETMAICQGVGPPDVEPEVELEPVEALNWRFFPEDPLDPEVLAAELVPVLFPVDPPFG